MDKTTLVDGAAWAQAVFGSSELGDKRRTRRVVDVAGRLARHSGRSLVKACEGDEIAQEGAYRWVRNDKVDCKQVVAGGFAASAVQAYGHRRLLAVEDSTTLSYRHALAEELGDLGGKADSASQGLWVHSVLLVDADSGQTVGLVEQEYWQREGRGLKQSRKQRTYEEKESYKWQRASERVAQRLGEVMSRTLSVCDREADVFEYLHHKRARGERFIVRAAQDRKLWQEEAKLFAKVRASAEIAQMQVRVPQRGGRPARTALLHLRCARVTLDAPWRSNGTAPVPVQVVLAEEAGKAPERLSWLLLTSEAADTGTQAQDILRCYGLRWRIEEFHKAWKSGAGVEQLRQQRRSNLLRLAGVLAFVAVRLLQLREALDDAELAEHPCLTVLGEDEWKVLWASTQRNRPLPAQAPNLAWAYRAMARLGGFTDTKRTGRASWETIWEGWYRLNERLSGYRLLQSIKT